MVTPSSATLGSSQFLILVFYLHAVVSLVQFALTGQSLYPFFSYNEVAKCDYLLTWSKVLSILSWDQYTSLSRLIMWYQGGSFLEAVRVCTGKNTLLSSTWQNQRVCVLRSPKSTVFLPLALNEIILPQTKLISNLGILLDSR